MLSASEPSIAIDEVWSAAQIFSPIRKIAIADAFIAIAGEAAAREMGQLPVVEAIEE